jgi:hypothetical protein
MTSCFHGIATIPTGTRDTVAKPDKDRIRRMAKVIDGGMYSRGMGKMETLRGESFPRRFKRDSRGSKGMTDQRSQGTTQRMTCQKHGGLGILITNVLIYLLTLSYE